ncbi:MAG TPA: hypothetical protein VFJ16_12525 [Longimicrobium sp.]|nr:hypothetical protein [Longimicrobium sp.]
MEKLKLSLEELAVTTFEATTPAPADFAPTRNTACETCRTLCLPYC